MALEILIEDYVRIRKPEILKIKDCIFLIISKTALYYRGAIMFFSERISLCSSSVLARFEYVVLKCSLYPTWTRFCLNFSEDDF